MQHNELLQKIEFLEQKVARMDSLEREIIELKKSRITTFFNSFSRKRLTVIIAISALSVSVLYAATGANLTTFTAGSTIVAEDVNANFQIVAPVGAITMYGAAAAPTGWLICNGSTVSRTDYAALFEKIGTTFGTGDGGSTFNLPDFQGIFPKGATKATKNTANKDDFTNLHPDYLGVLGYYSRDKIQGHKHDNSLSDPGHSHSVAAMIYADGGTFNYVQGTLWLTAGTPSTSTATTGITITNAVPVADGTNGTPRTGTTTEPQSLGVNFIIKY